MKNKNTKNPNFALQIDYKKSSVTRWCFTKAIVTCESRHQHCENDEVQRCTFMGGCRCSIECKFSIRNCIIRAETNEINRCESQILLFEQIHHQGLHVDAIGTQEIGHFLYKPDAIEALLNFAAGTDELSKLFHALFESEFQKRINHPKSNERHNDMHHFVLFTITELKQIVNVDPGTQYTACFSTTDFSCKPQWDEFLSKHAGDYAGDFGIMMHQIFEEKKRTPAPTSPGNNPHGIPDLWNFFYSYFGIFRIPKPNKKRFDDLFNPGLLECMLNALLDKIEEIARKTNLKEALHHGSMLAADIFHDLEYGRPNTFSSLISGWIKLTNTNINGKDWPENVVYSYCSIKSNRIRINHIGPYAITRISTFHMQLSVCLDDGMSMSHDKSEKKKTQKYKNVSKRINSPNHAHAHHPLKVCYEVYGRDFSVQFWAFDAIQHDSWLNQAFELREAICYSTCDVKHLNVKSRQACNSKAIQTEMQIIFISEKREGCVCHDFCQHITISIGVKWAKAQKKWQGWHLRTSSCSNAISESFLRQFQTANESGLRNLFYGEIGMKLAPNMHTKRVSNSCSGELYLILVLAFRLGFVSCVFVGLLLSWQNCARPDLRAQIID